MEYTPVPTVIIDKNYTVITINKNKMTIKSPIVFVSENNSFEPKIVIWIKESINKIFLKARHETKEIYLKFVCICEERKAFLNRIWKYKHGNIIDILGVYDTNHYSSNNLVAEANYGIAMECGTPLRCILEGKKYIRDIICGIMFLHEQGIVHMDIKPDNVVVVNGIAKIIDFELARALGKNEHFNSISCTRIYLPESKTQRGMCYGSDICCLGYTILELFTSGYNFDLQDLLLNENIQHKEFLLQMTRDDCDMRPSIREVYNYFNLVSI
ncbi:hypothetical protein EIN_197020 [Entamoeba invadens IP1]|uniref:non-specific serine/threonine protein kinase n=2 Tax=Entamoeba invadens IP1 TaxID=370355 RepID=L7FL65_ENTIV|nr:hypothetical protein EIN_197020 [Entamoeba invadens IP1]ELP86796.1 hypothetical protein EIN_197020 [Entamoeba invadens IP1]|eukprot:XP_004253567.1 hypothetical protein EIN_197020 [Entamoeba invadens IP1]